MKQLRKHGCNWKRISNYYGCKEREIKSLIEDHRIKENENRTRIQAPVLEVELFWNLIEKLRAGGVTLEDVFDTMKTEADWNPDKTNRYLNNYNIKEEIGRYRTKRRWKEDIKDLENLTTTEKMVINHLGKKETEKLQALGVDFLHKNSLIEVKTTLNYQTGKIATLQLNYAEEILEGKLDKKIYLESLGASRYDLSGLKRFFNFYDIDLYRYRPENRKFEKVEL